MRLINAKTLQLEEFFADVPAYGILSHTWGLDEVTFTDFTTNLEAAKAKSGFVKIQRCIDQALMDDISYCWVDTCCIDKSSSAELSEVINSMFRYYEEARICYVFWFDVDATLPGLIPQLESCRWFTRGWTLQELIAPKKRVFFDKHWRHIGSLTDDIDLPDDASFDSADDHEWMDFWETSATCPIPLHLLLHKDDLDEYCIAAKMSWASRRETTRIEDMAYCLLGIFDVNIPLLYGEGPKAFIRLQEELLRQSVDHSIFVWNDLNNQSSSKYRGLLARSPAEFSVPLDITLKKGRGYTYEMTNRGLRLKLPLSPTDHPGEYFACLDCCHEGTGVLAIVLAMVGDNNQFARVEPKVVKRFLEAPIETEILDIFVSHKIAVEPDHVLRSTRFSDIIISQFVMNSSRLSSTYFEGVNGDKILLSSLTTARGSLWLDSSISNGQFVYRSGPDLWILAINGRQDGTIQFSFTATDELLNPKSSADLVYLDPGTNLSTWSYADLRLRQIIRRCFRYSAFIATNDTLRLSLTPLFDGSFDVARSR
jgi:hypothetical protein